METQKDNFTQESILPEEKIQKALFTWGESSLKRANRWVYRILFTPFFIPLGIIFFYNAFIASLVFLLFWVVNWFYEFQQYLLKMDKLRTIFDDENLDKALECEIFTLVFRIWLVLILIYGLGDDEWFLLNLHGNTIFLMIIAVFMVIINFIGCYSLRSMQLFFASHLKGHLSEEDYQKTLKELQTRIVLRCLFLIPVINLIAIMTNLFYIESLAWRLKIPYKYQLKLKQDFPECSDASERFFEPRKPLSLQCNGCDQKCALNAESFCQLLKRKTVETPPAISLPRIYVPTIDVMYCGNCGSPINLANERYCRNCGNSTRY